MAVDQGDIYRCTVQGTLANAGDVQNVFQIRKQDTGAISDAEFVDDVLNFFDTMLSEIVDVFSDDLSFISVHIINLDGTVTLGTNAFSSPIVGTDSGGNLPAGIAPYIIFHTSVPRTNLRKFFAGLTVNALTDAGNMLAGFQDDFIAVAAYLLADQAMTNSTLRYCYQRKPSNLLYFPTSAEVPQILGYQRRRKSGVGG